MTGLPPRSPAPDGAIHQVIGDIHRDLRRTREELGQVRDQLLLDFVPVHSLGVPVAHQAALDTPLRQALQDLAADEQNRVQFRVIAQLRQRLLQVIGANGPEVNHSERLRRIGRERLPTQRLPTQRLPTQRLPTQRLPTQRLPTDRRLIPCAAAPLGATPLGSLVEHPVTELLLGAGLSESDCLALSADLPALRAALLGEPGSSDFAHLTGLDRQVLIAVLAWVGQLTAQEIRIVTGVVSQNLAQRRDWNLGTVTYTGAGGWHTWRGRRGRPHAELPGLKNLGPEAELRPAQARALLAEFKIWQLTLLARTPWSAQAARRSTVSSPIRTPAAAQPKRPTAEQASPSALSAEESRAERAMARKEVRHAALQVIASECGLSLRELLRRAGSKYPQLHAEIDPGISKLGPDQHARLLRGLSAQSRYTTEELRLMLGLRSRHL